MRGTRQRAVLLGSRCLSLSLAFSLVACGLRGSKDKDDPVKPAPKNSEDNTIDPRVSHIMLNDLAYTKPSLPLCASLEKRSPLPDLGDHFGLDGALGEWGAIAPLFIDPVGDAAPDYDLHKIYVGRQREDLLVAIATSITHPIYLEFGGIATRSGRLDRDIRRQLRVVENKFNPGVWQVETWEDQIWKARADEEARAIKGPEGIEVWLAARLLGDAVTWPTWWLRVYTRASDSSGVLHDLGSTDSTAAVSFYSMLGTDARPMSINICRQWSARPYPLDMIQLTDLDPEPDLPPSKTSRVEQVFGASRFALNAVAGLFEARDWPVEALTFVATDGRVGSSLASTQLPALEAPYLGIAINAWAYLTTAVEIFPQGQVIPEVEKSLLELVLGHLFPEAPLYLRQAVRTALLDDLVQQDFGLAFWFDRYAQSLTGVFTQWQVSTQSLSDVQLKEEPRLALTERGSVGFGHLLAVHIPTASLVKAWKLAATEAVGGTATTAVEEFVSALLAAVEKPEQQQLVQRLTNGWLNSAAFDQDFSPDGLMDADQDGVPGFFERVHGTDANKFDSDGDGWSDLAEILSGGNDALAMTRTPAALVPDGSFGDWLELLPKRINIDKGNPSSCPKAADIAHYGAIANQDALWIGAVATDFWQDEPAARWEGVIDLVKIKRQLLITATSGSREFLVKDAEGRVLKRYTRAVPMAKKTIEWVIHRQDLGLEQTTNSKQTFAGFDELDAVNLRLRTVFKAAQSGDAAAEDSFCDETAWFAPNVAR